MFFENDEFTFLKRLLLNKLRPFHSEHLKKVGDLLAVRCPPKLMITLRAVTYLSIWLMVMRPPSGKLVRIMLVTSMSETSSATPKIFPVEISTH